MTMIYDDINGHGYPIIEIKDLNNNPIKTIELPLCGAGGLTEKNENVYLKFNLIDYSEEVESIGFHTNFTLDYSDYASRGDMDLIKDVLRYLLHNKYYNIYLIPRDEYRWRKFLVNPNMDELTIKNMMGQGTEGTIILLRTKELQTDYNWINPSLVQYVGTYLYQCTGIKQSA
jgi:hypothetical protein